MVTIKAIREVRHEAVPLLLYFRKFSDAYFSNAYFSDWRMYPNLR